MLLSFALPSTGIWSLASEFLFLSSGLKEFGFPVVSQVDLLRGWCFRIHRLGCSLSRFCLRVSILVVGVWILCLRSSLCDPVPPNGFLHFLSDGWELSDAFLNLHFPALRFRGLWFANVPPDGFAFGRSLRSLTGDTFKYL